MYGGRPDGRTDGRRVRADGCCDDTKEEWVERSGQADGNQRKRVQREEKTEGESTILRGRTRTRVKGEKERRKPPCKTSIRERIKFSGQEKRAEGIGGAASRLPCSIHIFHAYLPYLWGSWI